MRTDIRQHPTISPPLRRLGRTLSAGAVTLLLAACGGDGADAGTEGADTIDAGTAADTQAVTVADAELATPESVLHDEETGIYLVSNINGTPLDKDGNGFISRVTPDGTVEALRWIDGSAEGVTIHAPKGMAISGDTLFVSDIDSVRAFSRTTGEYHGARGVPGSTFLNDLTVDEDGTLYVSDSGLDAQFASTGSDAIYRFDGDRAVAVAEGTHLGSPNGILAHDGMLTVVSFGSPDVLRIDLSADDPTASDVIATLPAGQADGIVRTDDGTLLVSSWGGQAVYRIAEDGGQPEAVVEGVPSPADIGWDQQRRRVLIPVFQENRLVFQPVR